MPTIMSNGWEKDTIEEAVEKLVEGHAYHECDGDGQRALTEITTALILAAKELDLDFETAVAQAKYDSSK